MWYVHCKGDECCERRERSVEEGSWRIEEGNHGELKKEVGELRVQSINKDKEVAEVKTKEEDSWATVAKKMKSHNVFERLEKVESDMIVKKSVIRKEVKSTNEEENRKKIIMIFNLKNKTGKSDVECVKLRMCLERWVQARAVMM